MIKDMESSTPKGGWMWFIPFILLPFCAFPNSILNKLQIQDLARPIFLAVGMLYALTASPKAIKQLKIGILILLFLFAINWISLFLTSMDFSVSAFASSFRLIFFVSILIVLPTMGILYMLQTARESLIIRYYMIPILIVVFISIIQILTLLNVDFLFTQIYRNTAFAFIEGSWTGNSRAVTNILKEGRLLASFHEPSVLATFILLYALPFQLSRFINSQYFTTRSIDFLLIILSVLPLVFSFSTTSYMIFSLDFLFFLILYMKRTSSIMRYVVLVLIAAATVWLISVHIEDYIRIVSRAFMTNNVSSATRFGSISGAMSMFLDNPLGVGYSNERIILFHYLPSWGKTVETSPAYSEVQSTFFRYLADFGIFWLLIFSAILYQFTRFFWARYKGLSLWQRDALFVWSVNFCVAVFFGFIEFANQWFLISCIFFVRPLFQVQKTTRFLEAVH